MKKLFYLFATMLFLFTASSCEEDWLDKKPLDAISGVELWSDLNNAELYVNNIYAGMPYGFARGNFLLASCEVNGENSYQNVDSHPFNRGELSPTFMPSLLHEWGISYTQIKNANIFFANIDNVPGNDDHRSQLKGEVHFLRAFYYAELLKRYGGVPLLTKELTLQDDYLVSRNSADEVLNFIVQELDQAATLLPPVFSGKNKKGRATATAALALKGRVLLYAGKYQESSDASRQAIDLALANGYGLHSPYYKIFLDNNNKEVLFDKQLLAKNFDLNLAQVDLMHNPTGYTNGWGATCPTQNFVDAYEMANGKPITDPASGYDANNPYVGRDPRFYQTVNYNGAMWKGRPLDTKENGLDKRNGHGDATKTGYYLRKFLDESVTPVYGLIQGGQHWIYIRLAEVYLNYAEAQLKLENTSEARNYVNMIRQRAGMPDLLTDAELTWDRYVNERRVELAFEEHYFWDVRRWEIAEITENEPVYGMRIEDIGGGILQYTKFKWEDRKFDPAKHYLFPIPQGEIEKNSKLEQNPGY